MANVPPLKVGSTGNPAEFASGDTIAVTNGGTGASSLTGHGAVVMDSSGTAQSTVAPGTTGNVLQSNGTDWTSAANTPSYGTQNALALLGGPNTPGASATTATFQMFDQTVLFGGSSNARQMPTSGTLTGDYYTSGNWTQTGTLTLNRCRLYFGGSATFNGLVTINTELSGGVPNVNPGTGMAGFGSGLNPGQASPIAASNISGGGGGGYAGAGGKGGFYSGTGNALGGQTTPFESTFHGSGGGGGVYYTTSGGNGGSGGGGVYIEAVGALSFTATSSFQAVGGNGTAGSSGTFDSSGGGGSGGIVDARTLSTITVTSGAVFNVSGGAGANTTSGGAGGGGGGGYISLSCAGVLTDSGTYTVSGGAAGTGSSGTAATAGASGTATRTGSTSVVPRRSF